MGSTDRSARIHQLKMDASTPKSRLMDILRDLEAIGAKGSANKLAKIIGQLESWQVRP